jgi:hypothetical protein
MGMSDITNDDAAGKGGFTPGPWSVSLTDNPAHGASWGGYWQIDAGDDSVACNQFCYAGYGNQARSIANARLIAAAPELLAAAQSAVDLISGDLTGVEWKTACSEFLRRTRAAIAKATQ